MAQDSSLSGSEKQLLGFGAAEKGGRLLSPGSGLTFVALTFPETILKEGRFFFGLKISDRDEGVMAEGCGGVGLRSL